MTPAPDPKGQGRPATPSDPVAQGTPVSSSPATSGQVNPARGRQPEEKATGLRAMPQGEVFFSESEVPTVAAQEAASRPTQSGVDRTLPAAVPAVATRTRQQERLAKEPINRTGLFTTLRLLGGLLTLGVLAYLMWTPGEWTTSLMGWVLLVILADEFGGWFGYLGLLLGGLGYFSPHPPPEQWLVILPLVGGALMALLLVKHSGGILVLPFAGGLFAGVLLAVGRFGLKFDPELKLPGNETFQRSAILAMLIGLGISFLRQLIGMFVRRRARLQARQKPTSPTPGHA